MTAGIVRGYLPRSLERAAAELAAGRLVAFPTETVYGLGADAKNPEAVRAIFARKGRPATNPLIVHVLDPAGAEALAAEWPEAAARLAAAFWPGPLTLVVPKRREVPDVVTAGGPTIALRSPSHPIARALLARFPTGIAAPSANRSSQISPTRAEHVAAELGDDLLILDGGPCSVGLESTVLDLTTRPFTVLRSGRILASALAERLGEEVRTAAGPTPGVLRSPGQLERHYAPVTPLVIGGNPPTHAVRLWRRTTPPSGVHERRLPSDPEGFGRELYDALRWADGLGAVAIWIEAPPEGEVWEAARDRLARAARPAVSAPAGARQDDRRMGGH